MAEFNYADLMDEGMLGFNPSPVFQPQSPAQAYPSASTSPYQSGQSTPSRGRGGRGAFFPRGGGRGASQSGTSSPAASAPSTPGRGRARGGGVGLIHTLNGGRGGGRGNHGGLGALNARGGGSGGRGGRGGSPYSSGTSTPRGQGVIGMGGAAFNPLLVPVKFVKASSAGLGTVGGEDEHGLEKAGAEAPQQQHQPGENEPWQVKPFEPENEGDRSLDVVLADEVSKLGLAPSERTLAELADEPEPFEPQPSTTATMALDEIEDSLQGAADPAQHPGLGTHPQPAEPTEQERPVAPSPPAAPSSPILEEPADNEPPLFEISTSGSALPADFASSLPPPAALAAHVDGSSDADDVITSDSDQDDEQIVYHSHRAVSHADPVLAPAPTSSGPLVPCSAPSVPPPPSAAPSRPTKSTAPQSAPAINVPKQSKKQLKRASRSARKAGRDHARTGNAHLYTSSADGGQELGGFEEEEEVREVREDREAGREMFERMKAGGEGMEDMLGNDDEEDEEEEDAAGAVISAEGHEDGQPRLDDSDLEWGESGAPPPRFSGGRNGKSKRTQQRQQRADQREVEKLERLVGPGSTREEVELMLAVEESLREQEREKALRKQGKKQREQRRVQEDYLRNLDIGDEEGDDSMAVLSAFAKGVVGSLGGEQGRGDDADRRLIEEAEEDEDAWGTSEGEELSGQEGTSSEEDSDEDESEISESEYERRLELEEEDSDEVDSDIELEMEYSLGDADGRVEHSLSLASTSGSSSDDCSLSSSDSDAELYAFEASLLAGQKVSLSSIGQGGGGGRKAERERKKERQRERKGKMKEIFVEEDSEEESEDDDDGLFAGKDSWAERDEDFIERMQRSVAFNGDLLETARGGKYARRTNRKERNKLFKAISEGNFQDFDGGDYDDIDEDIEAMLMDEEDGMMGWGGAGPSKKQRKKDKSFNGAFSSTLAAQWDNDRSKKAVKKAERAAQRAAEREADSRDTSYRFSSKKAGKKAAAAAAASSERALTNDAATVNSRIRHFITIDISSKSLSLPPMSKKARIAVHLLAEVYGLKSRSLGSGKNRFPVLERTHKTTVVGVSERKIRAIVGTADGENELDEGYERWGGLGRGGRPKGGKMVGLWKALEGADGRKGGKRGGGGGGGAGRNSEGAVVGQGADKLGAGNVGFNLLKKMGWTEGDTIGRSDNALLEPIAARVKTSKGGLGSGYSVSRRDAQELARAPQ
ncbi:hypothetical protein JCM11641_002921 [Rhodosporidiobolus odoratus]